MTMTTAIGIIVTAIATENEIDIMIVILKLDGEIGGIDTMIEKTVFETTVAETHTTLTKISLTFQLMMKDGLSRGDDVNVIDFSSRFNNSIIYLFCECLGSKFFP